LKEDRHKFSSENWELLKWLRTHEISLEEKYDLRDAPQRRKKKPTTRDPRRPEAELDLHGLTVEEALSQLKSFLLGCKLKGYYLVKIIHGKGLHSPGEAKLKELVLNYLNGEGKRVHSSYRSAPPDQGGEGAVLIFL
jgi:DNA-nicking Smr family endonuclease